MSRRFQIKAVPSTWLDNSGRRLDCGPYMSGAIEAKELLKKLRTEKLSCVTADIYHAGRESRLWVESAEHGIPFMGSTDILAADLSSLPFISKKQVASTPRFIVAEGWTLITRSGTTGRMAYARSDMEAIACSEHVMRVVPRTDLIPPGYLYAYLSSCFGVPLIASETYGAIIQHIEPHHIAELPVPRLGKVEAQSHELVQEAASRRVQACRLVADGIAQLEEAAGLPSLNSCQLNNIPASVGCTSASSLLKRMDGAFHSRFHLDAVSQLNAVDVATIAVASLAESIVEPNRFKRVQIEDPEFGVPLFGTTALMWAEPKPSYLIPRNLSGVNDLLVDQKTVLIPRSGQISGIIGTAVLPYGELIGGAVSEDAIRIHCRSEIIAGFIFLALRSDYGRRQLKARAYGSSIPHLDVTQIGEVLLPDLNDQTVMRIGKLGLESARLRDGAITLEHEARALVEHAIEEGGR